MLFKDQRLNNGKVATRGDLGIAYAAHFDALVKDRRIVGQLAIGGRPKGNLKPALTATDQRFGRGPLKTLRRRADLLVP